MFGIKLLTVSNVRNAAGNKCIIIVLESNKAIKNNIRINPKDLNRELHRSTGEKTKDTIRINYQ